VKSSDPDIFGAADALFAKHRVTVTIGGEPTFVPVVPAGSEWSSTALGPTKLRYAHALADALVADSFPGALIINAPGKLYPGEMNPRWALHVLWRQDGTQPVMRLPSANPHQSAKAARDRFRAALRHALRIRGRWLRGIDPFDPERDVWILPLDHNGKSFVSANWKLGARLELLRTEGAAGLRLPLASLPDDVSRRALTVEASSDGATEIFLPPTTARAFLGLIESIATAARLSKCGGLRFAGYVPHDLPGEWTRLSITPDPGVIEVNLPPCARGADYGKWLRLLDRLAGEVGLRTFKQINADEQTGTGGGNHLLFGGPTLAANPFFARPRWIVSLLRYWQHHPSLSYLFTGNFVGPSSQAPRPDESANALIDLEVAYRHLERLSRGDHRELIGETLRHLHTDASGNTHRCETSFDKFWNRASDGGCNGLIEFRAIESMPHAEWMIAVAALWRALAAMLLARPFSQPLIEHGEKLHDDFFLPSFLWRDFEQVLRALRANGLGLDAKVFREIFAWRFPLLLRHGQGAMQMSVRRAHEGWPLLCEMPLEGGLTSRFVDASIERLEIVATAAFAAEHRVFANGRRLPLQPFPRGQRGLGLRYRRTAFHPSLHPMIPVQLPLAIVIQNGRGITEYQLTDGNRFFQRMHSPRVDAPPRTAPVAARPTARGLTFDLRLS